MTPDSYDPTTKAMMDPTSVPSAMSKSVNNELLSCLAEEEGEAAPARSSSANHLDAIVDVLGVPSDLATNKRVFLKDEERETSSAAPSLGQCGKSKSCDGGGGVVRRRHRRRHRDSNRKSVELKRRSVYAKTCRGRSEAKACDNCADTAREINDEDLNREIFGVGPIDLTSEAEAAIIAAAGGANSDGAATEDEVDEDDALSNTLLINRDQQHESTLPSIRENIPSSALTSRAARSNRRFDAVRNLLEKARHALLLTR